MPSVYALSDNYGDINDYLQEYEDGTLSADAKNIYEALLKEGPLHAIELKRKVGLYGDSVKGKFDKAISELQTGLKILPVGVAEAGAWRYAFIYDLFARWYPDIPGAARDISRSQARVNLLAQYLRNVVYAPVKDIARIFGWKKPEAEAAIGTLVANNSAVVGSIIKGLETEVVLSQ